MPKKPFIKTLLERRIPQILGSYLVAGTSLILFIEYLVEKYQFPSHYPTLALFALIGILPSVIILSYFHGAPGKDEWTKVERIGIPINVLFIAAMLFFGDTMGIWGINKLNEDQRNIRDTFLINYDSPKDIKKWVDKIVSYENHKQFIKIDNFPNQYLDEINKYSKSYLGSKYMNLDVNLYFPDTEIKNLLTKFPPYQYLNALENTDKIEFDSLMSVLETDLKYILEYYNKDNIIIDGILNHTLIRAKLDMPDIGIEWVRFFDYLFWELSDGEINNHWHDEGYYDLETDLESEIKEEIVEETYSRIYEFRYGSNYIGEVIDILDQDLIKVSLVNEKVHENMDVKISRIYSLGKEELDTEIDDYKYIITYLENEQNINKYIDIYNNCKSDLSARTNNYHQILIQDSIDISNGVSRYSDNGFNDSYGEIMSVNNSEAIIKVRKKAYPFSRIKIGDNIIIKD